jgi:hypothetical protein
MSGSMTQTSSHKKEEFSAQESNCTGLGTISEIPLGKRKYYDTFLSFYCILIEILSRVANASRTSQGKIYILRRCFSCTVQKTGMEIVLEVFHPFPFYDLEDKLRYFASKSTGYLFREYTSRESTCMYGCVIKQLLHDDTMDNFIRSLLPIW